MSFKIELVTYLPFFVRVSGKHKPGDGMMKVEDSFFLQISTLFGKFLNSRAVRSTLYLCLILKNFAKNVVIG